MPHRPTVAECGAGGECEGSHHGEGSLLGRWLRGGANPGPQRSPRWPRPAPPGAAAGPCGTAPAPRPGWTPPPAWCPSAPPAPAPAAAPPPPGSASPLPAPAAPPAPAAAPGTEGRAVGDPGRWTRSPSAAPASSLVTHLPERLQLTGVQRAAPRLVRLLPGGRQALPQLPQLLLELLPLQLHLQQPGEAQDEATQARPRIPHSPVPACPEGDTQLGHHLPPCVPRGGGGGGEPAPRQLPTHFNGVWSKDAGRP